MQGFRNSKRHSVGWLASSVLLGVIVLTTAPVFAITASQVDVFGDGDYQNWRGATTGVLPDLGPDGAGDFALLVETTGFPFGEDSRLVTFNGGDHPPDPMHEHEGAESTQWTGDWTAAGVRQLAFDVRNRNDFELNLWLGIAGPSGPGVAGSGDAYVSKSSASIPADDQWHTVSFNVLPADFDAWGSGNDPAAALASVFQLRILHSPQQEFRGATGSSEMLLDNIRTVPEPSALLLAAIAAGGICFLRRFQISHGR